MTGFRDLKCALLAPIGRRIPSQVTWSPWKLEKDLKCDTVFEGLSMLSLRLNRAHEAGEVPG